VPHPSPLLAVPNVTAHPSTASVSITVLLYDGPLLCGFNETINGLTPRRKAGALRDDNILLFVRLFVRSFVCRLKRVLVGHWLTGRAVLAGVSGWSAAGLTY